MANLPLVQVPAESLRQKSREVTREELDSSGVQMLIENMADTMKVEGGVGLAAPQVGTHLRVIVVNLFGKVSTYINPVITEYSSRSVKSEEACLSIPGVVGIVKRFKTVHVKALDKYGKEVVMDLEGFPAIVFQHEIDHLDGILFIDRAKKIYQADGDTLV